jgi:hypothetical protein
LKTTAERINRLGRIQHAYKPATTPIGGTEVRRAFSRPIQDQQLVLDEDRFGHDGAGAAGPGKPGDGRQQVQKQNGYIAHGPILPTLRQRHGTLTNLRIRHGQPVDLPVTKIRDQFESRHRDARLAINIAGRVKGLTPFCGR